MSPRIAARTHETQIEINTPSHNTDRGLGFGGLGSGGPLNKVAALFVLVGSKR